MVMFPANAHANYDETDESQDEFEHQPLWGGFNGNVPEPANQEPVLPQLVQTLNAAVGRPSRNEDLPNLEGEEFEMEAESESEESEEEVGKAIESLSEKSSMLSPAILTYFRNKMLIHVSKSAAFFRNQQRGEAELTRSQKKKIAKEVLEQNPANFLARFGQFLKAEHLCVFVQYRGVYEVDFHLKEIERMQCKFNNNVLVKNRRYEAMKKLIDQGEYFSDHAMKQRNPHLFEHLVGKYLTAEERSQLEPEGEMCSLSTLLLEHADRDRVSSKRRQKQEREASAWEEEFDSSEDEEKEEGGKPDHDLQPDITEEERFMFREEFVSSMYRNFLEGQDEDFDYAAVDSNTEYDNLELQARDEEERYFDED